jgi:predicted ABC-type ATPase
MEQYFEILTKYVHKPKKHKVALFLCGAAGTGKTSSKTHFLKDVGQTTSYVNLNIDNLYLQMGKKGNFTKTFDSLLNRTIEEGYSFLYDKTCRQFNEVDELMKRLKEKGYIVKLGIVYATLKHVLERLKKRHDQILPQHVAKEIYKEFSKIANQYMNVDELFLYNNDLTTKLIFRREKGRVKCIDPNAKFYFDISSYCTQ